MRVVFLGATRGMGRSLARKMAERGDALFLLGRDPEQLSRSARDLGPAFGDAVRSLAGALPDGLAAEAVAFFRARPAP